MNGSILLTQEATTLDVPLWSLKAEELDLKDEFFYTGANFVYWLKQKDGLYLPSIIFPVDTNLPVTPYPSMKTKDPASILFLAGKSLDVWLKREKDGPNKMRAFVTKKGAITISVDVEIDTYLSIKLYADKYLLVLNNDALNMINLFKVTKVTKITGIPPDGTMATYGDSAVIWSRASNKRVTIDLFTKQVVSSVGLNPLLPFNAMIKKATTKCLIVQINDSLNVYDSSGKVILDRRLKDWAMLDSDPIVDSYDSQWPVIVMEKPSNKLHDVYYYVDNKYELASDIAFHPRAMIQYQDSLYLPLSTLELITIQKFLERRQDSNTQQNTRLDDASRYFRISNSGAWVLEIIQETKTMIIRNIFMDSLSVDIHTKYKFPASGPIITRGDFIPPFLYESKGVVRIWHVDNLEKGVKTATLILCEWKPKRDEMIDCTLTYTLTKLPPPGFFAFWFKTDYWIVLTLGPIAYVFDHDGELKKGPIELPPMKKVFPRADVVYMEVRGFDESLWFMAGYRGAIDSKEIKLDVKLIWQLLVWDGVNDLYEIELPKPIAMYKAVATGRRNASGSGRNLITTEILITNEDPNDSWYYIIYNVQEQSNKQSTFEKQKGKGLISETVDLQGRVYFARENTLMVYTPGEKTLPKFIQDSSEGFTEKAQDTFRALVVGAKKVWLASGDGYYKLPENTKVPADTKKCAVPRKPFLHYATQRYTTFTVPPTSIHPYSVNVDKMDSEALFETSDYIWISSKPTRLYKKPEIMLAKHNPIVLVLESGRLLVMSTYKEDMKEEKKVFFVLSEVLL